LALLWNFFGDPDRPDPFHEAIQPLLAAKAPELIQGDSAAAGAHPYALDVSARVADFDRSGRFGPVEHTRICWTGRHTAAEIRTMFGSFSPWLATDPSIREPLLDDLEALAIERFNGVVERPYNTAIYHARRR
ncbi:MAG: SAM-dependent methyltransferase, partial [Actinomycetota bacterium]